MCLLRNWGLHKLCASQSYGIADPSADDSSTGRGVVLGRAATKLRSIETQPLTGGSTSRRLVDSSFARSLWFSADGVGGGAPLPSEIQKYTVLILSTVGLPKPKTCRVPVRWIQNATLYPCEPGATVKCFRPKTWTFLWSRKIWGLWKKHSGLIVGLTKPETWRALGKWAVLKHWTHKT